MFRLTGAHVALNHAKIQLLHILESAGRKCPLLSLTLTSMFLLAGTYALADPQIGNVVQEHFAGASGTRQGGTVAINLPYTHHIFGDERVNTPKDGSTVIRFGNQAQLQIGADSSVLLDGLGRTANAESASGRIEITRGVFRYIASPEKDAHGPMLSTPVAALAVHGATLVVYVEDDGATTLAVLKGQVDILPCGAGHQVDAKSGQGFNITTTCVVSPMGYPPVAMNDSATSSDYSIAGAFGHTN